MVNRSAKKKKEDENKLNEENEARLKAQEQENERIRIEKESKRLREMQEKKELKQRADELKETRTLMNEIKYRLQQLEVEYRNDYAWKRYFLCDGSPNPSIEKEVNTFMSLWDLNEERTSMEDVMNDCVQSLKLIDELSKLISELNDNDEDNKARVKYEQTKHELLQQVHSKLDRATVETLSRAVHYADHETLNLQKIWYNDWIVMCIWGNLSKNPRIRYFTFPDIDVTFDIPKILTLSDCAFLITFMKFDNYSIQCQSYYPYKMPKSIIESSLVEETMPEDHLLIGDNGQVTDNQTVENLCSDEDQTTEGEEVVETPLEDRISTPEPDEWVKVNMEEDAVDLGNYHVVGGVIRFDLLTLPRQPRSGRGWTITTCVKPPKLRPFEYVVEEPLKTAEQMASDAKTEAESAIGEMSRKQEKDRKPPVQVKIRLPKCLVIAEDPVLARWDQEKAQWRTSGIQLIEFKENDNIIVFRTSVFGTIAVFQDYHINMPFQCWELRPLPIRICTATSAQNSINAGTMELSAKRVNAPVVTIAGHSTPSVYKSQTEIPKGNVVLASENIRENGLSTISIPEPTKTDVTKDDSLDSNKELMILGPVTTIGLSNEVYLSELPETNQCLLTITGGITDIRLHVLGDRVAILPSVTESGMYTKADTPLTGTTGVSGGGGGGSGTGTASVSTTGDGVNETEQTGTNLLNHTRHELKHLWGKWYTPDELITVLQLSGVNLFPREDSASRIGCINKNPLVEESMYENMALLSPSMAFGWSRWNSECDDSNTIVVTAVEHVDCEDSVDEESWKVYSITRKKVLQLKMKEYDEEYSSEANPSQPFHADFYHMYMDFASEEGKRRVEKIDLKYFKTVKKLLQSTRLLIFS